MAEVEEIKQTPDIQEINSDSYQHLFEGKVEVGSFHSPQVSLTSLTQGACRRQGEITGYEY